MPELELEIPVMIRLRSLADVRWGIAAGVITWSEVLAYVRYDNDVWRRVYSAYLSSPEWRVLRRQVLDRADGRCEYCGQASATQVHHRTYQRVGAEELGDLAAICVPCHENHHPHMPRTFSERWAAAADPTWERS